MSKELDLSGLPPELVAELCMNGDKPKPQRKLILDALIALDGVATKDEILIQVWRMSGQILKRQSVSVHLSLLKSAGLATYSGNRMSHVYALTKRGEAWLPARSSATACAT